MSKKKAHWLIAAAILLFASRVADVVYEQSGMDLFSGLSIEVPGGALFVLGGLILIAMGIVSLVSRVARSRFGSHVRFKYDSMRASWHLANWIS